LRCESETWPFSSATGSKKNPGDRRGTLFALLFEELKSCGYIRIVRSELSGFEWDNKAPVNIKTGIATQSFFGPEAEFFIFDGIRFDQNQHSAYYYVDSAEGVWTVPKKAGKCTQAGLALQRAI